MPSAADSIIVRAMTAAEWPAVEAIYASGIATGNATFETEPPTWDAFDATHLADHRFIALDRGNVVGWVAASAVSDRCVYDGVVEHSVYVDPEVSGRGVGTALLAALITSTEAAGIWTIQSGVFPENLASLALHERCGFRVVGRRERIGRHFGRWRDVVLIERRSALIS
jgi:phosphinothricin acetyltransferase